MTAVTFADQAVYGLIAAQRHETLGQWEVESPALICDGQLASPLMGMSARHNTFAAQRKSRLPEEVSKVLEMRAEQR